MITLNRVLSLDYLIASELDLKTSTYPQGKTLAIFRQSSLFRRCCQFKSTKKEARGSFELHFSRSVNFGGCVLFLLRPYAKRPRRALNETILADLSGSASRGGQIMEVVASSNTNSHVKLICHILTCLCISFWKKYTILGYNTM